MDELERKTVKEVLEGAGFEDIGSLAPYMVYMEVDNDGYLKNFTCPLDDFEIMSLGGILFHMNKEHPDYDPKLTLKLVNYITGVLFKKYDVRLTQQFQ